MKHHRVGWGEVQQGKDLGRIYTLGAIPCYEVPQCPRPTCVALHVFPPSRSHGHRPFQHTPTRTTISGHRPPFPPPSIQGHLEHLDTPACAHQQLLARSTQRAPPHLTAPPPPLSPPPAVPSPPTVIDVATASPRRRRNTPPPPGAASDATALWSQPSSPPQTQLPSLPDLRHRRR